MNRKGTPANLTPYKPGDEWTGNASGRPKKRPITDEYYQLLTEPIPEVLRLEYNKRFKQELLPPGATWARAGAIRRGLDMLMEGGFQASREMREAIEGKAPLRLEIQGTQRREVTIEVVYRDQITKQLSSGSNIELNSKTHTRSNGSSSIPNTKEK